MMCWLQTAFCFPLAVVRVIQTLEVQPSKVALVLFTCVLTSVLLTALSVAQVFTSSEKILELAGHEGDLLDALQVHINEEYDNLKTLSGFLTDRWKARRQTSEDRQREKVEHPNGAYHLIKLYTWHWRNVLTAYPHFAQQLGDIKDQLPTQDDYQGACSALIRLQRVYRLQVADMYAGNYSGYLGPPLQPDDAYEIGRQAFSDGFLAESRDWLEFAVSKLELQEEADSDMPEELQMFSKTGQVYGLLGRTYYFLKETQKAKDMYTKGIRFDNSSGDMVQLGRELDGQETGNQYSSAVEAWDDNMTDLCMRDKDHRVEALRPFHICRYKVGVGLVPYVVYKEEILSQKPYVSLFYDIVYDADIEILTTFVKGKMFRGLVGAGKNATTTYIRTSDLSWIYDDELELARTLSHRVKSMTGLEVDQRPPDGPSSSEAFQIVNYGLGGHYDVHMDPFDDHPDDDLLEVSGERIATFLIYLSDVEKGGNTVFVRSRISVAPKKGMALFWYNFDPKMEKDFNTFHAGCPVLLGHKWIVNKWIWTYGNTFRRPCGRSPHHAQHQIEPLMYSYNRQSH